MTLECMAETEEPTEQEIALEIFRETRRTRRLISILVGIVLILVLGAVVVSYQKTRERAQTCADSRATLAQLEASKINEEASPSLALNRARVEQFVDAYC
jgi:type VI protein secretion system component VasK